MAGKGKDLDRSAIMKQFGAPRRSIPRRPGSRSARLIDTATSLPNRVALMAEMDFALHSMPDHVGLVLVKVTGLPTEDPAIVGSPTIAEALNAAAARLRKACRPTDLVGRTGPDEVGAALFGLGTPDFISVVLDRVQKAFSQPVVLPGATSPLGISIGVGTAGPGAPAIQALAGARTSAEHSRPITRSA